LFTRIRVEQFQKDAVSVRTEIKQIGVMRHAFTSISGVKYEFYILYDLSFLDGKSIYICFEIQISRS